MSKLEVDKIDPQSGTDLELGSSGDTITIPTGATLDASNATTTLPANVVTTDGTQTLTNKSIAATQLTGTITPSDGTVTNAKVNASAAIDYSKLNLTGNIALADLSATGTKDSTTFLRGDNTFAEAGGGIEEIDSFGVKDLNINSFTTYTLTSSNTQRISSFSNQTFSKPGTGITIDTNGKVTFPSTGTYYITFTSVFSVLSSTSADFLGGVIRGTTDNGSNIDTLAENYNNNYSPSAATDKVGAVTSVLFTVSDTSNDKVYFQAISSTNSNNIRLAGGDPILKTKFTIIKLV